MRWRVMVMACAVSLVGCSGGDGFVVGEDDLCDWLTEDHVTAAARAGYSAAGVDWNGGAELVAAGSAAPVGAERPGDLSERCVWRLEGPYDVALVEAHFEDVGASYSHRGTGFDDWDGIEVVPYDEVDPADLTFDIQAVEHTALPEGVVAIDPRWGVMTFGTPGSHELLVTYVNLGVYAGDEVTFVVSAALMDALGWPD